MRLAVSGSALVHGAIVAALLIGFAWPAAEDAPAGTPVTVDIIALSAVASNSSEVLESDASQTLVSAGAESTSAITSETLAPLESTAIEPVSESLEPSQTLQASPVPATPVAPLPVEPVPPPTTEAASTDSLAVRELASLVPNVVAALLAPPVTSSALATTAAVQSQTLEPLEVEDLKVAPVPQTLTIARTSTPTYPDRPAQPEPAASAPPPQQAAAAGNGGESDTDAVASNSDGQQGSDGAGGDAEVAEYPNRILSKLRRALRYPRGADGASGEVHVEFVVAANGTASGIRVVRSSGNAAIDEASIATVSRAAPFPSIPPGANRGSWTFTVPLAFQK